MNQDDITVISARLDAFVEQRMRQENIPSVVLALTDREQTFHISLHGFADIAAKSPALETTLYETGSIGKSFTAIALLQVKDEGNVDLHAPITEYLPGFEVQSVFEPITLHHLLSHTAGIIAGTDFSPDPRFEVWALRHTHTGHPPGERFHYSNVGYKALGLVLERIEGRPYAEIIRERVLEPLGMTDTHAVITHELRKQMAVGYVRLYDDRPSHRADPLVPATWFQTNTADGCLASSIGDLATYARLYLNQGTLNGSTVISAENFNLLCSKVIDTHGDDHRHHYGYGIATGEVDGQTVLSHSGGMVGYFADMRCLSESGLGAVAMVNGIGDPSDFTRYALELLHAHASGTELPDVPAAVNFEQVENAHQFEGAFKSGDDVIELRAIDGTLQFSMGGDTVSLELRGPDRFYVPHNSHRKHLLEFGRDESGEVVEVFHGNAWYINDRYSGPLHFHVPEELRSCAGEYRSHNPWYPHMRVLLRKGRLVLDSKPEQLLQFDDGSFGYRDEPERLRFDTVVDGKALRLSYSCNHFYRFFTGDE